MACILFNGAFLNAANALFDLLIFGSIVRVKIIVNLQIFRTIINYFWFDDFGLVNKTINQGQIANDIDEPGISTRKFMDRGNRLVVKKNLFSTGHLKTMLGYIRRFL